MKYVCNWQKLTTQRISLHAVTTTIFLTLALSIILILAYYPKANHTLLFSNFGMVNFYDKTVRNEDLSIPVL